MIKSGEMGVPPRELRSHDQWVNWKSIDRGGKATKVPFQPDGKPASSTDSRTWSRFDGLSGGSIGFVFSSDDPYIGIDLDGCRDPSTGILDPWAQEIVERFATYTEVSPSGTGVKMFGVTDSTWRHKNKIELDGNGYNGKKPGIEVYDSKRYFAVTGESCGDNQELSCLDDQLDWLATEYPFEKTSVAIDGAGVRPDTPLVERASKYLAKMDAAISESRGHDACFKAACAMVLGFDLPTDEAYSLMAFDYNPRCQPPWTERELRHKVESAANQPGQRGYLADASPKDWTKIYDRSPNWLNRLVPNGHQKTEDETNEHLGTMVPTISDATDLLDAYIGRIESGELPQLLKQESAFAGIEVGVGLITIVGAPPGAGKTAAAMQVAFDGCRLDPNLIAYIANAEMGFDALARRQLSKLTRINSDSIRFGNLGADELELIRFHSKTLRRQLAQVRVLPEPDLSSLLNLLDQPPGLVVVDYLQKFAPLDADARAGVNQVVTQLRRLANHGHAILALSSTKRSSNGKHESKALDLACFKESGEVEFNADSAYVLADNGPIDEGCKYIRKMTLAHLKNRHGAKVDRELEFHMPRMEFSEPAPQIHQEFAEYAESPFGGSQ